MSHASGNIAQFASRLLRSFPILLLLFALVALKPEPANAESDAKSASLAVDIFVKAGQSAGLPITESEAEIVKQIVTCGVAGTPVGDCVRNIAVATALKLAGGPPEMAEAANCVFDGKPAATCAINTLVKKLPPEAQPMASCMVSGTGTLADCTKKLVEGQIINKVPADFQTVAQCVIEGNNVKGCASDFVVEKIAEKLPEDIRGKVKELVGCLGTAPQAASCTSIVVPDELKPLVGCATAAGANVSQCVGDFASKNLPADTPQVAKDMVGCIGSDDFGKCAKDKGIQNAQNMVASKLDPAAMEAIQKALDTIDKLRPDAPRTLDAGVSSGNLATVQNILLVAQGIKQGKMGMVVEGAGPELAIIASNIILSIFLTPAVAGALGPAVEAMIHNDVTAAKMLLDSFQKGDAIGVAKVIFTWYETQFIDKPCALLGNNDVKDTICGGLSDAIKFIADTGGDLAKDVLGVGKDILQWLGVWGLADSVATKVFGVLTGAIDKLGDLFGFGSDDEKWTAPAGCASFTPKGYFADHYLTCVTKATDAAVSGSLNTAALDGACVKQLNDCTNPKDRAARAKDFGDACGAMGASLRNLAQQVGDGMRTASDAYASYGGPAAYVNGLYEFAVKDEFGPASADFCDPNFWNAGTKQVYADKCGRFVSTRFPMPRDQVTSACPLTTISTAGARNACIASLNASLAANAAKGVSLAGPDSDYCKRQKDWIALHPCTVESAGKPFQVPGGKQIDDIKINCVDLTPRSNAPWLGAGSPSADSPWKNPGLNIPDGFVLRPRPGDLPRVGTDTRINGSTPWTPPRVGIGPGSSSGFNMVNNRTNEGLLTRVGIGPLGSSGFNTVNNRTNGGLLTLPRVGIGSQGSSSGFNTVNSGTNERPQTGIGSQGSSGFNTVNSGTNERPKTGIGSQGSSGYNTVNSKTNEEPLKKMPQASRIPAQQMMKLPPASSSGINKSTSPNRNSAMDRLSAGGNSGGAALGGRAATSSSGSSSGINKSRSIPSGGSSGISTSRPIPSGSGSQGSSGSNTSRSF